MIRKQNITLNRDRTPKYVDVMDASAYWAHRFGSSTNALVQMVRSSDLYQEAMTHLKDNTASTQVNPNSTLLSEALHDT